MMQQKLPSLLPYAHQVGLYPLHSPSNFNVPSSKHLPYHAWFALKMVLLKWTITEKTVSLHNICFVLCAKIVKTVKPSSTTNSVALVLDMFILEITDVPSYDQQHQ